MNSTESKHTSGPWKLQFGRYAPDAPVFGFTIKVDHKKPAIVSPGCYEHHAYIVPEYPDQYFTPAEVEANARLIAAAPDLLAACRGLLLCIGSFAQTGNYPTPNEPEIKAAQTAIKKASDPTLGADSVPDATKSSLVSE